MSATASSRPIISPLRSVICAIRTDCSNPSIPRPTEKKQALAAAAKTIDSIGQSRLQMSFALSGAVSYPLVYIVVGWGVALFCGFGLMSKGNAMSVVALVFGAVGSGQRHLSHSRSELPLFRWTVSRFAGAAQAGAGADEPRPGRRWRQPLRRGAAYRSLRARRNASKA